MPKATRTSQAPTGTAVLTARNILYFFFAALGVGFAGLPALISVPAIPLMNFTRDPFVVILTGLMIALALLSIYLFFKGVGMVFRGDWKGWNIMIIPWIFGVLALPADFYLFGEAIIASYQEQGAKDRAKSRN